MKNITINAHSSIQIDNCYFDPFMIKSAMAPAKYVFITHTHYDHLSIDDIEKVVDENTTIIATDDAKPLLEKRFKNQIIYVKPNQTLELDSVLVETFPAYNINKEFHKKEYGWVGYKVTIDGTSYAVVGDTDVTEELENLQVDVLLLPISGKYTMNDVEAAELVNKIKPKLAIPTHYSAIVGSKDDESRFKKHLSPDIKYQILIN